MNDQQNTQCADQVAILYAPFEHYVTGVMRLMIEHLWQWAEQPQTSVADQLTNVAWISRLVTLDNRVMDPSTEDQVSGWPQIRTALVQLVDKCSNSEHLDTMIQDCMEILLPVLEKQFVDGYRFPKKPYNCWWYTIHEQNTVVAVHIINADQPRSPFDDPPRLAGDLLRAIEAARAEYPTIHTVECGTWLNHVPKFLRLWPDSYKEHREILNETGGFGPGAWGQYMLIDGRFNAARAEVLRKTGRHPYPLSEARCPTQDATAHLRRLIGFGSTD